ncbi:MAG: pantoate--beta-alanine ligase [Candidatus Melainabacteria bacterium]|nr:pantoate--beta-alanine ligase [Candidatus Melainabacteria bacterium]
MAVQDSLQNVVGSIDAVRQSVARARLESAVVGLVPTMGALHGGHEELIATARSQCDFVAVSIFVNPLQFGPREDFASYPRTLAEDAAICSKHNVDLIFAPEVGELYGDSGERTRVSPAAALINRLCGTFRPGHFEGVATVVAKLFNIVGPDRAYFGLKDYQQLQVIRHLVRDLDFPIEIIAVPTVREKSGLALSSRNKYLSSQQKELAPALSKALRAVARRVLEGENVSAVLASEKGKLESAGFRVQYLELCHPDSLEPLDLVSEGAVALVAAYLGDVRLIDNIQIDNLEVNR